MRKHGRFLGLWMACNMMLTGCVGGIWTGAKLVYDRHNVYKKINDYRLALETTNSLYVDKQLKCQACSIDIAAFNGDLLIAGHLPSQELYHLAEDRLSKVSGYRRLFNQLQIRNGSSSTLEDSWITTKIRTQIIADDSIDPNAFKIITMDRKVYLMGDVKQDEAEKVIQIARQTSNVVEVVKMLKYFSYKTYKNKVA